MRVALSPVHGRLAMRACLLAVCVGTPAILPGQTADPRLVQILAANGGRTARIAVDSGRSAISGRVGSIRGDTLYLMAKSRIAQTLSIPRIIRVDVRESLSEDARLQRTQSAAMAGLLIGAAIGYAIAVPSVRNAHGRGYWIPEAQYFLDPAAAALVGGAVAGVAGKWRLGGSAARRLMMASGAPARYVRAHDTLIMLHALTGGAGRRGATPRQSCSNQSGDTVVHGRTDHELSVPDGARGGAERQPSGVG